MTLYLVATMTCDFCGSKLNVAGDNLRARNAAMVARGDGWRYYPAVDKDACPECVDRIEHPEKQLSMGVV